MEGHPWAEMGKSRKPITLNKLARMLKPLGVGPVMVGPRENRLRGYRRGQFEEAFDRYLPGFGGSQTAHPSSDQQKQRPTTGPKLHNYDFVCSSETPASPCNPQGVDRCTVENGENGEKAHVCAQCGKPADGREEFCAIDDDTVWLTRNASAPTSMEGGGHDGRQSAGRSRRDGS
jgi:hypothetical protein